MVGLLGVLCSSTSGFRLDVNVKDVGRQEDVDDSGPTPIPPGQTAETLAGVGTLVASILGGLAQPINAIYRRPDEKPQQQAAVQTQQVVAAQPTAVQSQTNPQVQPIVAAVNALAQPAAATTEKTEEGDDDDDDIAARYRL